MSKTVKSFSPLFLFRTKIFYYIFVFSHYSLLHKLCISAIAALADICAKTIAVMSGL
jgi:hypothetical protein